jgi:hypothetical protein
MLTSNAQLFWDTSFLHTALMSSLRQSMTQGSLRTMKSKLGRCFSNFCFYFSSCLITQHCVEKPNFKFENMYVYKLYFYHGYSYLCPSLPGMIWHFILVRSYCQISYFSLIEVGMYLLEIPKFSIQTYKLSNKQSFSQKKTY